MIRGESGFTLLELLVAIVLAGATALLARTSWLAVTDQRARAASRETAELRSRTGRAWLRQLVGSMEGASEQSRFTGGPRSARFTAWVPTVAGWSERGDVELRVNDSAGLQVRIGGDLLLPLDEVRREARLDYLLQLGARAAWLPEWESGATLPAAIRLRWRREAGEQVDTLVMLVGPRG